MSDTTLTLSNDISTRESSFIDMPPKVAIIIVNWNGADDTIECIKSLKKCSYPNYETIIVDNGSNKGDVKLFENEFEKSIQIIKNNTNLGFAGGVNTGIKFALKRGADYILLLNNDTIVEPDFLNILIKYGERDSLIGVLTPKICYYSAPHLIWSAGGYINKIRSSGVPFGERKKDDEFNENRFISFASGCCMLIKRRIVTKIGLFDENYFLYLEDVDFCWRVLKEGYKILYVARSKIYHKVNVTSKKASALLPLYYTTRNRIYFARKLLDKWFFLSISYLTITMFIKSMFWITFGSINKVIAIKKAFADFIKKRFNKALYFNG